MEMEYLESPSKRCFKSFCLWLLLSDIIFILSFVVSASHASSDRGWAQVGWIIPLFVKIFMMIPISIAAGYFALIVYLEKYENEKNLPLKIVDITEKIFNKIAKNKIVRFLISFFAILSLMFNASVFIAQFYTVIITIISFVIMLLLYKFINRQNKI